MIFTRISFLIVFTMIFGSLYCDEDDVEYNPLTNLDGIPNAMVNGCVNVISGDYCDFQKDVAIPGIAGLTFERSYVSSESTKGTLCYGWHSNHISSTLVQHITLGRSTDKYKSGSSLAKVFKPMGGRASFHAKWKKNHENVRLTLASKQMDMGLTNCGQGRICAATNPKNECIQYDEIKKSAILKNGAGEKSYYQKRPGNSNTYDLICIEKNNGHRWHYSYTKKFHIQGVEVKNSEGDTISSLDINFYKNKSGQSIGGGFELQSPDNKNVQYMIRGNEKDAKHKYTPLRSVEQFGVQKVSYGYSDYKGPDEETIWKVNKKSMPNNRCVEVKYYQYKHNRVLAQDIKINFPYDLAVGRVSVIKAPVGTSSKPIPTHSFIYKVKDDGSGRTSVYDAFNTLTKYYYSKNKLDQIFRFENGKKDTPYSIERFYWGQDETFDVGNLMSHTISQSTNSPESCRTYAYDKFGNILEETFYGNLTGHRNVNISMKVNGIPVENGTEKLVIKRDYSKDGKNLLVREDDGIKVVTYAYKEGTDLVERKLFFENGSIKLRHFYFYDVNAAVSRTVMDDGERMGVDDLRGVSERHIVIYENRKDYPIGLPDAIEKRYLDLDTSEEKLISRIEYSYNKEGWVSEQRCYDANKEYMGTKSFEYDRMGRVIKEVNPLGEQLTRRYDDNDNLVFEQGARLDVHKEFVYDFHNRLIREDEVHLDGLRLSKTYRYNYLNNKIAETDVYGNETLFYHDSFGRIFQVRYPFNYDEMGNIQKSIIKSEFNILSQPIAKIDARGHKTVTRFTTKGDPALITYADGTQEFFRYNITGTLQEKIDKNGLKTVMTYDYQNRPIEKSVYSESGGHLYTTRSEYNGFQLTKEIDASGVAIEYFYDYAGNLIRKVCGNHEERYEYNAYGQLAKLTEMVDDKAAIISFKEYDVLMRVVEERTEDQNGNIQERTCYCYDCDGNKSEIMTYGKEGIAVIYNEYNVHGDLVRYVDPEGKQTVTQYCYDYINEYGQCVGYREITDPMGNLHIVIKNAHGDDCSFERRNSFGTTIQKYRLYFDLDGNTVSRIETVIDGDSQKEMITRWEYDSAKKMTRCTEACGTVEQKITSTSYTKNGEMERVVKADGTVLLYDYDSLGRLCRYSSSIGDIDYRYHYDILNRPIKIEDLVNNRITEKRYDLNGNLIEEVLGNNLCIAYQYDRAGRQTCIMLPDESSFEYVSEGKHIKKIVRKNKFGNEIYCHEYLEYDQSEKVIAAKLIGEAGNIQYGYDLLRRPRNIEHIHWSEVIAGFDDAGNITSKSVQDIAGASDDAYVYDDLYQIKSEQGSFSHTYSSDSVYNRTSKDDHRYHLNNLNQILNDGEYAYTYCLNGNLTGKESGEESWKYKYDSLGRLVLAEKQSLKVSYSYDEENRRLFKNLYQTDASGNEELLLSHRFLYQGKHEIGTVDSDDKIINLRVLGKGLGAEIGAAIAIEALEELWAPIHDHNGNVVTLINARTGLVSEAYRYSAFGEETIYDDGGIEKETSVNPWRFSSKRVDAETGYVYFGQRYYDPHVGRWVTPDPIGHEDGPNLYAYVKNNPLTSFDLWGELTTYNKGMTGASYALKGMSAIGMMTLPDFNCSVDATFEERCGGPYSDIFDLSEHGAKPLPDNMGVGFIPGMLTDRRTAYIDALHISKLIGGYNVTTVWNPSHGFFNDLGESSANLYYHVQTMPCVLLQKVWTDFFKNTSDKSYFLQYCHSQGVILVRNALENFSEELRKRIIIVAIAPGGYVSKEFCYSIQHYASKRDFVNLLDREGRWNCRDTTTMLTPHKNANWWDHDILSPTYAPVINDHFMDYMKMFSN